jgi:hypothetical protein
MSGPPLVPPPARSSASPVGALVAVGVVGFGVMVVAAIGAFLWARGSSAAGGGSYRPAPQSFNGVLPSVPEVLTWNSDTPQFFGSDGEVPNLVTTLVLGDAKTVLAGVSGATGKILWRTVNGVADVYTDERERVLRYDLNKSLTRYDSHTGKVTWSVRLVDDVEAVAFGTRCIALRITRVADVLTLDSDTGKPAPCTTPHPPEREGHWGEPPDLHFQRGDVSYVGGIKTDAKPVNPEPPHLVVTASRAGKVVWENAPTAFEPVWESGGFDRSLAFTPAGAFLYGRSSSDHIAHWAMLDYTSGKILYQGADKTRVSTRVHVATRGSLVFVVHDFGMHAYNAASGAEVWALGGHY